MIRATAFLMQRGRGYGAFALPCFQPRRGANQQEEEDAIGVGANKRGNKSQAATTTSGTTIATVAAATTVTTCSSSKTTTL